MTSFQILGVSLGVAQGPVPSPTAALAAFGRYRVSLVAAFILLHSRDGGASLINQLIVQVCEIFSHA